MVTDSKYNGGDYQITSGDKGYVAAFAGNDNALQRILNAFRTYLQESSISTGVNVITTTADNNGLINLNGQGVGYDVFLPWGAQGARIIQPTVLNTFPQLATTGDNKGKLVYYSEYGLRIKSSKPTIDKTVTGGTGASGSVQVGDKLTYTISATVPTFADFKPDTDAKNNPIFYMQDTPSSGLTLFSTTGTGADDFKVYKNSVADANELASTDYKIVVSGNSFKVSYNMDTVSANTNLYVVYKVKVNENAILGSAGNSNTYDLIYSNDPKTYQKWDNTPEPGPGFGSSEKKQTVKTYGLVIDKVDSITGAKLSGVTFEIYDNAACTGKPLATSTTSSAGAAAFDVLDLGDYWLKETKVPEGYSLPTDPVKVTLTAENVTSTVTTTTKITYTTDSSKAKFGVQAMDASGVKLWLTSGATSSPTASATQPTGKVAAYVESIETTVTSTTAGTAAYQKLQIKNTKGITLPETGGIGTTLFYVIGGLMVAGAGIVLITKRRMRNMEQ